MASTLRPRVRPPGVLPERAEIVLRALVAVHAGAATVPWLVGHTGLSDDAVRRALMDLITHDYANQVGTLHTGTRPHNVYACTRTGRAALSPAARLELDDTSDAVLERLVHAGAMGLPLPELARHTGLPMPDVVAACTTLARSDLARVVRDRVLGRRWCATHHGRARFTAPAATTLSPTVA